MDTAAELGKTAYRWASATLSDVSYKVEGMYGTEIEKKVKDATSNEPWGCSSTIKNEIANATHRFDSYSEIMAIIWKRLEASNWRVVFKTLTLLDHLIKTGSERVVNECRSKSFIIYKLITYESYDENNIERGRNIREFAKSIYDILNNDEHLLESRNTTLKISKKCNQNGYSARNNIHSINSISSDTYPIKYSNTNFPKPDKSINSLKNNVLSEEESENSFEFNDTKSENEFDFIDPPNKNNNEQNEISEGNLINFDDNEYDIKETKTENNLIDEDIIGSYSKNILELPTEIHDNNINDDMIDLVNIKIDNKKNEKDNDKKEIMTSNNKTCQIKQKQGVNREVKEERKTTKLSDFWNIGDSLINLDNIGEYNQGDAKKENFKRKKNKMRLRE